MQLFDRAFEIEGLVMERSCAKFFCQGQGQRAHLLLGVLHHHLKKVGFCGGRAAAEGDRAACFGLQVQSGGFQCVGHGDLGPSLAGTQVANAGKQMAQPGLEARQLGQIGFIFTTTDHGFDGRVACPEIGAAQRADT